MQSETLTRGRFLLVVRAVLTQVLSKVQLTEGALSCTSGQCTKETRGCAGGDAR